MLGSSTSFTQDGEKEWLAKLELLGNLTDQQKRAVTCAVHGHSAIVGGFLGYVKCGRCDAHLGDRMFGYVTVKENPVYIGDFSDENKIRYSKLGWIDTLFVDDPFYVGPTKDLTEVELWAEKLAEILNETNADGNLLRTKLSVNLLETLIKDIDSDLIHTHVLDATEEIGLGGTISAQAFFIKFLTDKYVVVMHIHTFLEGKPYWDVYEFIPEDGEVSK